MTKKILLVPAVLAIVVVVFLEFAATRPGTYVVERSTKIAAPASVVFAQLDDFKAWGAWSPWEGKDPQMKKTYDGPARGVGATYAWQGNDQVGEGNMAITDSQPPTSLKLRLEFIKPFAAVATTAFQVAPAGEGAVTAKWSMTGTSSFMSKIFGMFSNMDTMIGGDFDKGLAALKQVSETEAKKQVEADVTAKAQADAAAEKTKADAAAAEAAAKATSSKGKGKGKSKGKKKKH
jgi:hypothetical protein